MKKPNTKKQPPNGPPNGRSATSDYLKIYDLERYLFEDVHNKFHSDHWLGAFDFFCIVIWKANRAKSKIAAKLLSHDPEKRDSLEDICRSLTHSLYGAEERKARFQLLVQEWKFGLPMASAILSVCWPEDFTIYDYRVRELIGDFPDLNNRTRFENIWDGYEEYQTAVKQLAPNHLDMRDKDRYLWGQSFARQLESDINKKFKE